MKNPRTICANNNAVMGRKLSLVWLQMGAMMLMMEVHGHTHVPKPQDYLVRGLELVEPAFAKFEGSMYAGLIPTTLFGDEKNDDADDGTLMFWLFAPDKPIYTDTLVVWLNGGPGCSSLGGNLFENGPVTIPRYPAGFIGIDPLVSLEYNPYAWTNATAIMYVEQPHATGFSTGPMPQNETDVGRDFYHFLQNLFAVFDGSAADSNTDWRTKKLNLFGESYAGMYVPSIAHYIHERNLEMGEKQQQHRDDDVPYYYHVNLAGIALGNGWMDALVQGPAVIDYAFWHGMIDTATVKALKQEWENCKDGAGHQPHPFHSFTVPDECGILEAVMEAAGMGAVTWGTPNAYDVTTWDPYLMLDMPSGSINQFYNNPAVQKALNVPHHVTWIECMPGAGRRRRRLGKTLLPGQLLLDDDRPISVVPYVADLLDARDAEIRVLIYSGDRDMTTNAQGSEMLLDSMEWSGAAGWASTSEFERGLWLPGEEKFGGYIKHYRNLEFLIVYNSGHLVPFNQDEIALDLITRFLGGVSFLDKPLPKFHVAARHKFPTKHDALRESSDVPPQVSADYGVGWSVVFGLAGFVLGFLVSRRGSKGRGYHYQMIPSLANER